MKVHVIHGAPLSGKSTYVENHKGPNDLIYDFDLIMSAISGLPKHAHNKNLLSYVVNIRGVIINQLKDEQNVDNAWIITTRVSSSLRNELKGLDVEYIEIEANVETLRKRLEETPGDRDKKTWERAINEYLIIEKGCFEFQVDIEGATDEMQERHLKAINDDEENIFYKSWAWQKKRLKILERDNWECQRCKVLGRVRKADTVHHIKELKDYPELGMADENLISLCFSCHNFTHARFGERESRGGRMGIPERW